MNAVAGVTQKRQVLLVFLAQGFAGGTMLGDFAHQVQGIGRQRGINRENDVDQDAGRAAHLLARPHFRLVDTQALLAGEHGVGHGAIRLENVRCQPAGQKTQRLVRHFDGRTRHRRCLEAGHFLDEIGMERPVADF